MSAMTIPIGIHQRSLRYVHGHQNRNVKCRHLRKWETRLNNRISDVYARHTGIKDIDINTLAGLYTVITGKQRAGIQVAESSIFG